jgi:hypothetical protein
VIDRVRAQLERVRAVLPGGHGRASFSQEGEDLLYRRGWRGMNIDAAPGSMGAFKRLRSRDINLEVGVAATSETRPFYVFNEPALNTFDAERAKEIEKPPYRSCKPSIGLRIGPAWYSPNSSHATWRSC